jgi:hypothetical protein
MTLRQMQDGDVKKHDVFSGIVQGFGDFDRKQQRYSKDLDNQHQKVFW